MIIVVDPVSDDVRQCGVRNTETLNIVKKFYRSRRIMILYFENLFRTRQKFSEYNIKI
jgi:hypothetical protein